MNRIDTHAKVLWISDIHWSKTYIEKWEQNRVTLEPYLNSFHKSFNAHELDYIIVTGDITNRGDIDEYQQVMEKIFQPILEKKRIPIITVPGNHDLDREIIKTNTTFLKDFISKIDKGENKDYLKMPFRERFFKSHLSNFSDNFKSYTSFVKNQLHPLFNNTCSIKTYTDDALYGICLDKERKIIFILLNSSWYSFGEEFLKFFMKSRDFNSKNIDKSIKKTTLITTDYGTQILGLEILSQIDELIDTVQKYPEYVTVLLMHHPINWLIRKDQIPHNSYRFPKLMKHVDILLTGHEHVLSEHPVKRINDQKTIHLEAGEFMTHHNQDQFNPSNNWFSLLDINVTKRTIQQTRLLYHEITWKDIRKTTYKLDKKHHLAISKKRRIELITFLQKKPDKFLQKYFPECQFVKHDNFYKDQHDNAYFIQFSKNIDVSVKDLLKIVMEENFIFKKFFFVFFDIFHTFAQEYSKEENDRILTLNKIKQDYDLKFDILRYHFYAILSADQSLKFKDTMFVSKIIPFWEIEHFDY